MAWSVYIPLGVIGLVRWISWIIRRIPAALYKPIRNGHVAPISVVTPVYQEDPEIYRAALESWLGNVGVTEVICVIDVTDVVCQGITQDFINAGWPVILIVTDVPGKRDALRKGWEVAQNELVALVDSDTLWSDDVAARVVEPFADPRIGGVGTRQNVYNPISLWQRLNDMYLDYRYFDEIAAQTKVGRAVSCLSGRTAIYRRSLLLQISEQFMHETCMGVQCNSGEDKRLTSLILEEGHLTYLQRNARVWSTFPTKGRTFFRQRLRWARNTWRSDLRAMIRGWVWRRPFLAFGMIDKAVSSFTLLVSPVYLAFALYHTHWVIAGALVGWWVVSRSAKQLPHLQRKPSDFFLMPAFITLSFAMAGMKIWALLTMRKQLWLTREVAVIDGQLVRTGEAEHEAAALVDAAAKA